MRLLQIYYQFSRLKNFGGRSKSGDIMAKSIHWVIMT